MPGTTAAVAAGGPPSPALHIISIKKITTTSMAATFYFVFLSFFLLYIFLPNLWPFPLLFLASLTEHVLSAFIMLHLLLKKCLQMVFLKI